MQKISPYTPPIVTVDAVIFRLNQTELEVLLIKRNEEPFAGSWALPGGYCAAGQTTIEALSIKVREKTSVDIDSDLKYMEQLYTFDTVDRDPRGHAVSVTYMGCSRDLEPKGGNSINAFYPVDRMPKLAYDHEAIIRYARERLGSKLTYTNAVYGLLDDKFTLSQLQTAYEAVFGRTLDKRNFRKKFHGLGLIHETGETWREGAHRPAQLYAFNSKELDVLDKSFD